ncbi:MAG: thiamine pyrophosphate-binding protein [Acidobacteriaceae bacterium]|nr:thiamine pyrophosphate-binding protein [Acidobacteriaceae bacterium]
MNASDILVERLLAWGVDTIFGLPGDGINGVMEALRKAQNKIRFIHVRHEESAAFMACAYAKFTGRLGVCLSTSGPGGIHLLNGLYDAKMDQQPVLAITGMQFNDVTGTFQQQDVELDKVFMDVACYNNRVMSGAHMESAEKAFGDGLGEEGSLCNRGRRRHRTRGHDARRRTHTGNSTITALINSDPKKASELGEKYDVAATYSYEEFAQALQSGTFDAIYLATPNWRHAEFIVPALEAGIHVLTEKPLEISTAKCKEILAAEKASTAKLMVAYRLHFEPATLDTIEKVRSGKLGRVHLFSSNFAQLVDPKNHRAHSGNLAGPVLDMGPYPVNAARYIFGDEPTEVVSAAGTKHPESGIDQDFADTVAVTLRFPGERLAQFNVSYFGNPINTLLAVGEKGSVQLDPAYVFGKGLEQTVTIGEEKTSQTFKNTDHFGGEMKYFSDCILNDVSPEPDGEEGFADVRVLEGILEVLKTGQSLKLEPFSRSKRIDIAAQKVMLAAISTPELVDAKNPGKGVEKQPKN